MYGHHPSAGLRRQLHAAHTPIARWPGWGLTSMVVECIRVVETDKTLTTSDSMCSNSEGWLCPFSSYNAFLRKKINSSYNALTKGWRKTNVHVCSQRVKKKSVCTCVG